VLTKSVQEYLNTNCAKLMAKIHSEHDSISDWERELSVGRDGSLQCLNKIGHGGSGGVFKVPN
jgi:hypothetical protein